MSQVFLSYRQTDDEQRKRVRAFGQRLHDCGIDVVLDQFFLDANPGGPNDGWDKWSSDRALHTEYVLIIGTEAWFQCFEKKQPPGTGLGAACEADDVRHRIYEAGGLNKDIRIVLFDDADRVRIPGKLSRYQYFHAERDFKNIVRWLRTPIAMATGDTPRTSVPHNLPSLQPFFGRQDELRQIAGVLDPKSHTRSVLIDGPGGMGKTSLAVRAAYDVPPDAFEKIVFISLKSRELDDTGVRDLSGFLISGLAELLNELARELDHPDIAKAPEDQRPRLLLNALRGTRTLLVLDNLESLTKSEADIILTFVTKLPSGCRAILTSRVRIGGDGKEIILQRLSRQAALEALSELAKNNRWLAKTSEQERIALYEQTDGKPLLLLWTADQLGRGYSVTFADAIAYLRSCPEGNDPLEFVFGNLAEDFSESETRVLCALTYFTLPAKVDHLAELAGGTDSDADRTLRSLVNRSLVVPSEELKTFTLVPLVADFLRKKKPEVVAETGGFLEKRAYALVVENGYENYDRFPVLDAAWPTVAAALPRFLAGPNDQLQIMCDALVEVLNFTGRWDERLALLGEAEAKALAANDFLAAGWRACEAGWTYYLRQQSTEVLACSNRAEAYWRKAQAGIREQAFALRLRGNGHKLAREPSAAIAAHTKAVELFRILDSESVDVAKALNSLADAERLSGDLDSAERDYREALRLNRVIKNHVGVTTVTTNLVLLAVARRDWSSVEVLAREALLLSEEIEFQEAIAFNCLYLAVGLERQGKCSEALPHARRAEEIFTRLGSPKLAEARKIIDECES